MAGDRLSGRVAVIPVGGTATARVRDVAERLAAEGAAVVLVTGDDGAPDAGRLASSVEATGGARPAVFSIGDTSDSTGDDADDLVGLVEFLGEMFRPAP